MLEFWQVGPAYRAEPPECGRDAFHEGCSVLEKGFCAGPSLPPIYLCCKAFLPTSFIINAFPDTYEWPHTMFNGHRLMFVSKLPFSSFQSPSMSPTLDRRALSDFGVHMRCRTS